LLQATCCADKEHCCPSGYQCDIQQQKCVQDLQAIAMTPVKSVSKTVAIVSLKPLVYVFIQFIQINDNRSNTLPL
jgi:hypothetical protein